MPLDNTEDVVHPDPRDHNVNQAPSEPPPEPTPVRRTRRSIFERMFDDGSNEKYVKNLLGAMLLVAAFAQTPSIIYTAFGDNLPDTLWDWTPALAAVFFLALDWTILPLCYAFTTTRKPGLKIVVALLLMVVSFGAFEGYFTATERLIQKRLESVTAAKLDEDHAKDIVDEKKQHLEKMIMQQAQHVAQAEANRQSWTNQIKSDNEQIATAQEGLKDNDALNAKNMAQIRDNCKIVSYPCVGPKMDAESKRYKDKQDSLNRERGKLHTQSLLGR